MTTLTYNNPNSNGQERVTNDDGIYYVSSNLGRGWYEPQQVSRETMVYCLAYTCAPSDVVAAILGAD